MDSAGAFLAAWGAACNDTGRSGSRPVLWVPAGRFLISQAYFKGPCRSAGVDVAIDNNSTVFAPSTVDNSAWIMFHHADGLAICGGTLDGQGQEYWACKKARRCTAGQGPRVSDDMNFLVSFCIVIRFGLLDGKRSYSLVREPRVYILI